ncbi:MAG: CGNR zinc finger domain-containing protein, partial [Sulfurifustaceae bacterium]
QEKRYTGVDMRLSRKHAVPPDLALLYEFVNSLDLRRFVHHGKPHETGDELGTVSELELWMRRRALLDADARLDPDSHRRALELRDALRRFLQLAPANRPADTRAAASVNASAATFPMIVHVSAGAVALQPAAGIRSAGLGRILAELQHAGATGRLDRLKMCAADECRWVFYDRSKPGTRRWCASTLCGNREKTRAYRQRRRESTGVPDASR